MRRRATVLMVMLLATSSGLTTMPSSAGADTATERAVCGPVPPDRARCMAHIRTDLGASSVDAQGRPFGTSPALLKDAYNWPTTRKAGAGQTVAVITAYSAPNFESDFRRFNKEYDLPACTGANGCLTRVNDTGGATLPPAPTDEGWALETTLDVEWVHAIAPAAKILLVEAENELLINLFRAVNYANSHATYISGSWGGVEVSGDTFFDSLFQVPGNSYFFSSGDEGAGPVYYPASSPHVVAVGGTALLLNRDGQFKAEKGWIGSGGGCSIVEAASSVQTAFAQYDQSGCAGKRAFPDVAALGDPATGGSIFWNGSWSTIGGTSLSAPLIAARAAVRGTVMNATLIYGDQLSYRDIKLGNNGFPCLPGYDLVTGRGSLKG